MGRSTLFSFEPLETCALMAGLNELSENLQGTSEGDASDRFCTSVFIAQSPSVADASSQPVSVSSVAPSRSGFTIQFSRPVDPAEVHLFDATQSSTGASDVTLIGSTTGEVRGSVVFDTTNTALTFIKTGSSALMGAAGAGTLAPDTYTLTLRSSATGFVDLGGNPLRDIGGGNAGDFVSTFTVDAAESNAVTLSVPDFARL